MNNLEFSRLIQGSKEYRFEGSVLTIIGYYTGKRVSLDLSLLTEDMLEELMVPEDDDEEDL